MAYGLYTWCPKTFLSKQAVETVITNITEEALRASVVYRIMLALVAFHLFMSCVLLGVKSAKGSSRSILQTGLWPIKFMVLLGSCIGSFWIPQWMVLKAFWPMILLSATFIAAQEILLIDLACSWSESLVQAYEETEGAIYKWTLILTTLSCFGAFFVGSFWLYVKYKETSDTVFVVINTVLTIIMTMCSMSDSVRDARSGAGIFPAAILSVQNLYLLASAIMNKPVYLNAQQGQSPRLTSFMTGFGCVMAFLSIGYSAFKTGENTEKLSLSNKAASQVEKGGKQEKEEDEDPASDYNFSLFHGIFVCAACYVCLVLTDWSRLSFDAANGTCSLQSSSGAYWVKIVTSWVQFGLYMWVLYAPVLMPDRFD